MKRILSIIGLLFSVNIFALNIGLLTVATGKYTCFVKPLIESARTFFCKQHDVTFFVFTDGEIDITGNDIVVLPHKRYGWPYDTLFRYCAYWDHQSYMKDMDYLFACDADMLFVDYVDDEILSDRVGTLNPGFVGRRGTYEERPQSVAYVAPHEGDYYFAGGFYGGKRDVFFEMLQCLLAMVYADMKRGIIAIWHDESYLNRYFIDFKPTLVLPRAYCARPFDQPQKLVALDKNHNEMRS
jgi:histo-blood group ABO system transferase